LACAVDKANFNVDFNVQLYISDAESFEIAATKCGVTFKQRYSVHLRVCVVEWRVAAH